MAGAGEWAAENARVMQIHDRFGAGGSLAEDHAPGFNDAVVPRRHDGPDHRAIARGRIKVRPRGTDEGKVSRGVPVAMAVQHGPVTVRAVRAGGAAANPRGGVPRRSRCRAG